MAAPPLPASAAVAILSLAALLLLLAHRRAHLGTGATAGFVACGLAYGWLRSTSIDQLGQSVLAGSPYRLHPGALSLGGVPVQELLGWVTALAVASFLGDRLVRRVGLPADAWNTAFAAAVVMAALCLTVESAAVTGGWWTWALSHSPADTIPFPSIALIDWAFVAFDFLLPFELWRRRAPRWQRGAALLVFPVHFAGHAILRPLADRLPLTGFDVVHIGIPAFVIACAWSATLDDSPWPLGFEDLRLRAALGAGLSIIVGTTVGQLAILGEWRLVWTAAPLTLLALVATGRGTSTPSRIRTSGAFGRQTAWAFLLLFALGLFLRLPDAIRARDFRTLVSRGTASFAEGRTARAISELEAALRLRPDHPDVLWLLGWARLSQGKRLEARPLLEASVARRPGSVEATRYLALLDLLDGRAEQATILLAKRQARFGETADLRYLAWFASSESRRRQEREAAIEPAPVVRVASASEKREIARLADALGDAVTAAACR